MKRLSLSIYILYLILCFLPNYILFQCPTSCLECNSPTDCTLCNCGYYLENATTCSPVSVSNCCFGSSATTCEQCLDSYFLQDSSTCTACPENCFSCNSATTCNECDCGYYLENSSTCSACSVSNCCYGSSATTCSQCLVSYFLEDSSTCTACPENCFTCNSATDCTECYCGYYLENSSTCTAVSVPNCCWGSSTTRCATCLGGYYVTNSGSSCCSNSIPNCYECDSLGTTCLTCKNGFSVSNGSCLSNPAMVPTIAPTTVHLDSSSSFSTIVAAIIAGTVVGGIIGLALLIRYAYYCFDSKPIASMASDFLIHNEESNNGEREEFGDRIIVNRNYGVLPNNDFSIVPAMNESTLHNSAELDFRWAWECLHPEKSKDPAALKAMLEDELRVFSARDLERVNRGYYESIAMLLKPAPQNHFRKALQM